MNEKAHPACCSPVSPGSTFLLAFPGPEVRNKKNYAACPMLCTHPLWSLDLLDQVLLVLAEHQVVLHLDHYEDDEDRDGDECNDGNDDDVLHLVARRDVVKEVKLLQQVVGDIHVGDPLLAEVGELLLGLLGEELEVLKRVSRSQETSDYVILSWERDPPFAAYRDNNILLQFVEKKRK